MAAAKGRHCIRTSIPLQRGHSLLQQRCQARHHLAKGAHTQSLRLLVADTLTLLRHASICEVQGLFQTLAACFEQGCLKRQRMLWPSTHLKAEVLACHLQAKYVEVLGGAEDLMEAIYTKGPMTVSVDASSEAFRFYKSGVFNNTECVPACHCTENVASWRADNCRAVCSCKQKLDELDHAVIVSGYGTTDDGQDYWLMKNTWYASCQRGHDDAVCPEMPAAI